MGGFNPRRWHHRGLVEKLPLVDGYRVVGIPWARGTRIAREKYPRPPEPAKAAVTGAIRTAVRGVEEW